MVTHIKTKIGDFRKKLDVLIVTKPKDLYTVIYL